jgi:DedD protein
VLIAGGFALGLVAGVVSEEPELVVGHLVGRTEEVPWVPDAEPELTPADRALGANEIAYETAGTPEIITLEEAEVLPVERTARPDLPSVATAPPERRPTRESATSGARDVSALPPTGSSATASASRAGFAVQVGAFADSGAAQDVRHKLRLKGFDSFVISASESGDGKWRVRVGPVPTRGAAERLASRLKTEERLPTWVLAQGGGS